MQKPITLNLRPAARQRRRICRPCGQHQESCGCRIVIDGVLLGNEFLRIGPGVRASIRAMAAEGRR